MIIPPHILVTNKSWEKLQEVSQPLHVLRVLQQASNYVSVLEVLFDSYTSIIV